MESGGGITTFTRESEQVRDLTLVGREGASVTVGIALIHNSSTSIGRSVAAETRLQNVPERHDGQTPFTVDVRFSGTPTGLSATRDGTSIFEASGGTVTGASVKTNGAQPVWTLTVTPGDAGGEPLTQALEAVIGGEPMTAEFS